MFPNDFSTDQLCLTVESLDQLGNFVSSPEYNAEQFLIFHCNIRSLRANFNEFKSLLNCYTKYIPVIICSEIWISEFEIQLYYLEGYKVFNCCRKENRSGGVLVYVKENYDFANNLTWPMLSAEGIVLYSNSLNICLIALYRSHAFNIDFFNQELGNLLLNLSFKNCVLIGDININILETGKLINDYLNILSENGFISMLNIPTRVTDISETCIDHIFVKTNSSIPVVTARLIYELTDHYPILCNITLPNNKFMSEYTKKITVQTDNRKLTEQIIKLEVPNITENVNLYYNSLQAKIQNSIELATVSKDRRKIKGNKTWINSNILKLINDKQKLYMKTKKYPHDMNLKSKYKSIVVEVKHKIKCEKEKKYYEDFIRCGSDQKAQWKLVNNAIGKNKKKNVLPKTNNENIVNDFNDFFINCANVNVNGNLINTSNFNINYTECKSFFLYEVSEIEIINIVNALNENKSAGYDKISVKVLKMLVKYKPEIIVKLINMSFEEGVFPENLKVSTVTPIYKSGEINCLGNYRPISVLPIFSKIIETAMKNRLYKFLNKNNFFSKNQFGFIKGLGTEDALLRFTTTIYKSLNDNIKTVAIFIDISKAFDSVNHDILLSKMYAAGVRGKQREWFKTYLTNRKQFVRLHNLNSSCLFIKKGVPQGSILGPLLFIIFINDFCNLSLFGQLITYADDTVLIYSSKNYDLIKEMINSDLIKVKNWFQQNDLIINSDKTKYINFNLISGYSEDIILKYHILCHGGVSNCKCPQINRVKNIKYLGLHVDQTFKWNLHVKKINDKLRFGIYAFYYLRNSFSKTFLKQLYFAWIQSIIQYGITSWGGDYLNNIKPLINTQSRLIRLLNCDSENLENQVLTIRELYVYNILLYLFKNRTFCSVKDTVKYNLRTKSIYNIPKANKEIFHKSFIYLAPKIFNSLPEEIVSLTNKNTFKKEVKRYILNIDVENLLKSCI